MRALLDNAPPMVVVRGMDGEVLAGSGTAEGADGDRLDPARLP